MIINGDALHIPLADCSVDSIVCDPPYGLSFMGKKWDHGVPGVEFWIEALRVAKPGAHMLAFGGTRTYHRLTCAIEDAGWEIRDCIMWVYGSGFPKSLDIGKAIDKAAGAERECVGTGKRSNAPGTVTNKVKWVREAEYPITIASTESAKQWDGWGTALKPAYEPIILARKPLDGTTAQNVLKWGCGGINIDGCRVETDEPVRKNTAGGLGYASGNAIVVGTGTCVHLQGRFPANFIHDGSDEVVSLFPVTTSGGSNGNRKRGPYSNDRTWGTSKTKGLDVSEGLAPSSGSAARFFKRCPPDDAQRIVYSSKALNADRDEGLGGMPDKLTVRYGERGQDPLPQQTPTKPVAQKNHHPTVKNSELMRYLCKLITPPNGLILDMFCGSGSTGKAAAKEGFQFIGIEKEWEYCQIAKARYDFEALKPNQMRLAA